MYISILYKIITQKKKKNKTSIGQAAVEIRPVDFV